MFGKSLFLNKYLNLSHDKFEQELINWSLQPSHDSSSLFFDKKTIKSINKMAITHYTDSHRYIAILQDCVIIGSYLKYNNQTMVVMDELIQTYPEHCIIYIRSGKPSPITGIYIAKLNEVEE